MSNLADIALFVFNRPEHTRRTLQALEANPESSSSRLWLFSDGPRHGTGDAGQVNAVRKVIREHRNFREIVCVEHTENLGLAESIRIGISTVLRESEQVIVLEDDIVTSPGFLRYMNQALQMYATDPSVMNICGYLPETTRYFPLPETFFHPIMSCWGWGTWRRAWMHAEWDASSLLERIKLKKGGFYTFDMDGTYPNTEHLRANLEGKLKTWAIFWVASCFLKNGLSLFPRQSLVDNIGLDGSGCNCSAQEESVTVAESINVRKQRPAVSLRGRLYFRAYNVHGEKSGPFVRLLHLLRRIRRTMKKTSQQIRSVSQ
jgi:hypothetical protein